MPFCWYLLHQFWDLRLLLFAIWLNGWMNTRVSQFRSSLSILNNSLIFDPMINLYKKKQFCLQFWFSFWDLGVLWVPCPLGIRAEDDGIKQRERLECEDARTVTWRDWQWVLEWSTCPYMLRKRRVREEELICRNVVIAGLCGDGLKLPLIWHWPQVLISSCYSGIDMFGRDSSCHW